MKKGAMTVNIFVNITDKEIEERIRSYINQISTVFSWTTDLSQADLVLSNNLESLKCDNSSGCTHIYVAGITKGLVTLPAGMLVMVIPEFNIDLVFLDDLIRTIHTQINAEPPTYF